MVGMRTVLVGRRPLEVEALIERRRALGQDLFDEVWDGDYHMAPAPHGRHGSVEDELAAILRPLAKQAGLRGSGPANIGTPSDYRVPDRSYFAADTPTHTFNPTAEIVVEVVSPNDESRMKYDFYFRVGVHEVLIVDPELRTVEWFTRGPDAFGPSVGSKILAITAEELHEQIDWPA
jgi:Uma2 family endonuclease